MFEFKLVREEIKASQEDTRRYMDILYEKIKDDFKALGEKPDPYRRIDELDNRQTETELRVAVLEKKVK